MIRRKFARQVRVLPATVTLEAVLELPLVTIENAISASPAESEVRK